MLELDCGQEFAATHDERFFAGLPPRPGVLLLEVEGAGAEPYLARTADIRRAAERILRLREAASKRLNLRDVTARIRYRVTGSKFEQLVALYEQVRTHFPQRYRERMRLRPAALLKVNLRGAYPRCYVTRWLRADEGFYFGPFGSRRSADAFAKSFLDLFKIRRCQIKIRRDPSFPGCIYSEMKMCLAPCFAGCSKEEYDAEVGCVLETLGTRGEALTGRIERKREAASASLDFERAAALHKRLEKSAAVLRGLPEIARRIDDLHAVILQRGAEKKTIIVFPVRAGLLAEPIFLRFGELSSQPRPAEAILREGLEPEIFGSGDEVRTTAHAEEHKPEHEATPDPRGYATGRSVTGTPAALGEDHRLRYGLRSAPLELAEHVALIARWFYSKPREGEIFFREKDWPYRRILRACGRLLGPPGAWAEHSGTPQPALPQEPPPRF